MISEFQLRVWLGASDGELSESELSLLGLATRWPRPRTGDLRFVAALLRDVFPDDSGARAWLHLRRWELHGQSASEAVAVGDASDVHAVERLLVREWWANATISDELGIAVS